MKIMFLIRALDYGGAQRQLATLAKGMHEQGYPVVVALFYPGGALEKDLREVGVPIWSLEKRHRWDAAGFLMRLIQAIKQEQPDVLFAYTGGTANILTAVLRPLFPRLRVVWSVRASNTNTSQYERLTQFLMQLQRVLSRFAHLIVANSQAGAESFARFGFPRAKMVVIPNGIDTQHFTPVPENGQRVRIEWGVREDEKLIGIVARFDMLKDHPTFLKAAALLAQERDDVRFVCVGDGAPTYRQELHRLGEGLGLNGRLIWAGMRYDMPAVYSALDIATLSSVSEGFSNTIGEAMACGVPCTVTDVGDSAWIVGDTGVVVPARSAEQLCRGWHLLLDKIDRQYINGTRRRIVEHFSLGALVERTAAAVAK